MSNYTKTTNFASKDNLSPGNPLKIVKGAEIDTEFNNIQTAVATKTDNASANITGGSITGITDLAIADGGTGASTATAALNNLLPSQTGNATKYLQTDGSNATWDAVSLSTSDITGTLPVANGGTGVTSSTGTGSVVLSNSPTLVTPALGTPASATLTNATGLPISTGVSGLGTGVATFLATPSSANLASAVSDETGSGALVFANSPTLVTPALGTPSSGTLTNATGLPISTGVSGLGTGVATFLATPSSANLISAVTDETGTGSLVFATSPTLVTPALGTPSSATLTNATGLPIATGVSGLGTGVATALAVNVGSSGAPLVNGGVLGTPSSGTATNLTGLPISTGVSGLGTGVATALAVNTGSSGAVVVNGGALGTPSSGTATNLTGLPLSTGVTGTLPVANGGTGQTSYTDGQLLIGNTTGNTLTKATLTAGSGISITNGGGSITIATSGGGTGDVTGPTSSTDNALARFDSTTGKIIQNSVGILSDTGAISGLTDISASGSVTLSGGTANGVTYLNGSKVLTSGSALVFDGTNLGIGASPTSLGAGYTTLDVRGSTGGALRFGNSTNSAYIYSDSNETNIATATNKPLLFSVNAAEQMRLTSTGLGIGTSSPTAKLTVSGNQSFPEKTAAYLGVDVATSAGNGGNLTVKAGAGNGSGNTAGTLYLGAGRGNASAGNGSIAFGIAQGTNAVGLDSTYMTLDASGNLGLGVTPSAWSSLIKAFETSGGSLYQYNGSTFGVVQNAYYDGSWRYKNTSGASSYFQSNSVHYWNIAPSGTAGDAISFTQAMTLDASGNLLVGKTSNADNVVGFQAEPSGRVVATSSASTSAENTLIVYSTGASAYRFYVGMGGTINATNTTITAISDQRLKENIRDLDEGLATVMALKPRKFDWKEGKGQDIKNARGFIAQEFEEVLPDMIETWRDPAPEGEEAYKAINANLIPTLVKAIQELKTEFDAYKASHP